MLNKNEILKIINSNRNEFESFGIRKLGIFGSFVKDQQNEESDIDFIVEFDERNKNFRNFMKSYDFLEHLFKRKIELITEDSLKDFMKAKILNETEYVYISK
jgi:uncharacterized protein